MFSSDACCFRNGQLKQFNELILSCGEGWGKQKHFIQAKTLEKIRADQAGIKTKKTPENPTLTIYTPFFTKKVPLSFTFYQ